MYIWHICAGNGAFGQLSVVFKYLALVDRSFLHLCLIPLLWVCVLTLGNLVFIKGIRKDVRLPLFSHTENRSGNLGIILWDVCMSCLQWIQCARNGATP